MTHSNNEPAVFWGELAPSDHLVQIYERDEVFLDSLEGFVSGGIRSGDAVVVIATEDHRNDLAARLDSRGIDVAAAEARGQYIPVDADAMLATFMRKGWPDDDLFARAVTDLLARARVGGRAVRAFGEMVALLWARGDNAAVIRLEHLWHSLCAEKGFALLCAYPRSGFTQGAASSIREICAAHSKVFFE